MWSIINTVRNTSLQGAEYPRIQRNRSQREGTDRTCRWAIPERPSTIHR